MKFAVGITFYHPSKNNLKMLEIYTKEFDLVYIYDNSKDNSSYIKIINSFSNIVYFYHKQNDGLPIAFNTILADCYKKNIDFLCTLDQDSALFKDEIDQMKFIIRNSNLKDIGIYALHPVDYGRKKILKKDSRNTDLKISYVDWAICSGSFLNLQLIKLYNIWYDKNYFIDRFDADFCKQINLCGKKIVLCDSIQMEHACGDENHQHSVLRNYYIFRNRYYFNSKYFNRVQSTYRTFLQNARQITHILKEQDNKIQKMNALKIAKKDFKNKDMGKIKESSLKKLGVKYE